MSSMELAAVDENLYLPEAWLNELELVNDIDHATLPAILLPYSSSQESARFANSEADTTNLNLRDEQLQMVWESMISAPHDHDDVAGAATTSDLQMSVNNLNLPPHRSSYLLDCSTRAMCKKVTLKEAVMYEAIEKLGGGEKGLHLLMDHVRSWIAAAARNCSTTSTTDQNISISDSLQQLCVTASDQASPPPPPPPPSTSPPLQLAGADHLYITDLAASHMSTSTQNAVSRYSCKAHRKRKRSSIANTTATETNYHTDSSCVYTRSSSYDHSCWNRIVTNPLQLEKRRLAGYNVYHSRSSMSRTSSTAAAATRAARKHRMAYLRQQLIGRSCAAGKQPAAASSSSSDYAMQQQQPTASAATAAAVAATGLAAPVAKKLLQNPVSSTANKQQYSRNQFFINSPQKQQGLSTGTLVLLLHKLLQPSDVTSLGRIVLPKKEAESCLPYLAVKEGMSLAMEDFDTGKTWKVRYRYWPNNRSRMYLIENTGVFVRSHQLEEGDLLILYRNVERNKIVLYLDVLNTRTLHNVMFVGLFSE
ncbi:hypothetical protein CY35_09G101100 [Sphagnum magellanicum]|nr:hypothetical protein CY35_09G101100 [Sphagnum magellanicum]KAH9553087.1 hypothetical protein CY35_09G101100 [Sphagnum magellanicum]